MGKLKIKKSDVWIDMTPMSDVMVLLLTFFMLTSTFVKNEPVKVIAPKSVSEIDIPEQMLLTVHVDSLGHVFMTTSDQNAQLKALETMMSNYSGLKLTREQKLKFKIDPMWGIPVSQLSAYLNLDADKMSAAIKQSKGIPTDSTTTGDKTSEFQDWVKAVKSAYKDINSDEVLKIAIKCSADAPYGRVKKVISELQDLDESRYYLVTNLKKNKDKED